MNTPFPPRNGVFAKFKPKTSLHKGHPMHYQSLTAALEQYSGSLTHHPASPNSLALHIDRQVQGRLKTPKAACTFQTTSAVKLDG